jgi:serine/threonine-protein kinase
MAPEQIVGQPLDRRADIFSLGLVLYEMLTGTKPFQGEDIPELTFKVANLPAAPPSYLAPDLPPVIDFIIARALKKKPDDRYATALEMAKDLQAAMKDVEAADGAAAARGSAETVPNAPEVASRSRIDGAVLPADEHSRSRGGWTVPVHRASRRVDRARAVVTIAYALALAAAIAIAVYA